MQRKEKWSMWRNSQRLASSFVVVSDFSLGFPLTCFRPARTNLNRLSVKDGFSIHNNGWISILSNCGWAYSEKGLNDANNSCLSIAVLWSRWFVNFSRRKTYYFPDNKQAIFFNVVHQEMIVSYERFPRRREGSNVFPGRYALRFPRTFVHPGFAGALNQFPGRQWQTVTWTSQTWISDQISAVYFYSTTQAQSWWFVPIHQCHLSIS
jgi:hypothetical protein